MRKGARCPSDGKIGNNPEKGDKSRKTLKIRNEKYWAVKVKITTFPLICIVGQVGLAIYATESGEFYSIFFFNFNFLQLQVPTKVIACVCILTGTEFLIVISVKALNHSHPVEQQKASSSTCLQMILTLVMM